MFSPFAGHWHGHWRQADPPEGERTVSYEHDWGATRAVPGNDDVRVQHVVLVPGRVDPGVGLEELVAINAVHLRTGLIVGGVGLTNSADGRTQAARPHVGFSSGEGRLIWLAEESRTGTTATYSVFFETAERDAGEPARYTIVGSTLTWDASQGVIVGEPETKAGRYVESVEGAVSRPVEPGRRPFVSTRFRAPGR